MKIRGFRIELGEIEARLREHASVREAVVLAREDVRRREAAGGVLHVAATARRGRAPGSCARTCRRRCPSTWFRRRTCALAALPLTPNGKLDRRALPAPDGSAYVARAYEAPVGEIEEALAQIWCECSTSSGSGARTTSSSWAATRSWRCAWLRGCVQAGLHADIRTLFTAPTLGRLGRCGRGRRAVSSTCRRIVSGSGSTTITPEMLPLVELSEAEIERIVGTASTAVPQTFRTSTRWRRCRKAFSSTTCWRAKAIRTCCTRVHRFDSRARLDRFVEALQAVIDRHDILRTAVVWEGLPSRCKWCGAARSSSVEEVDIDPRPATSSSSSPRVSIRATTGSTCAGRRCCAIAVAHDAMRSLGRWCCCSIIGERSHDARGDLATKCSRICSATARSCPHRCRSANFVAQARLGVGREEHEAFFREMLGDVEEPTAPFGLTDVQGDGSGIAQARRLLDPSLSAAVARAGACARGERCEHMSFGVGARAGGALGPRRRGVRDGAVRTDAGR